MAALCEAFTLCGLGPSGGVGQGGGILALEPGPGPDHVLLTDRGRTATLFKVTPGTAQPCGGSRHLLRPGPGAPRSASGEPPGSPGPARPGPAQPPAALPCLEPGSVGAPWARREGVSSRSRPARAASPHRLCAGPGRLFAGLFCSFSLSVPNARIPRQQGMSRLLVCRVTRVVCGCQLLPCCGESQRFSACSTQNEKVLLCWLFFVVRVYISLHETSSNICFYLLVWLSWSWH